MIKDFTFGTVTDYYYKLDIIGNASMVCLVMWKGWMIIT